MKILFVYPRFQRHADVHPELREFVPMNEYLGSPSLAFACLAAATPPGVELEFRDDRIRPADRETDADLVALSFFTPAATRGLELADAFRRMGKPVVAGGIFPTMMPDEVAPHVDAVVVGEGESVWAKVIADAAAGRLAPRYHPTPLGGECVPTPRFDVLFAGEDPTRPPDDYPVQLSRGCPLACAACALPTSMGGALRPLGLEAVLGQLTQLARRGRRACLTEDTSWLPGLGRRALEALFEVLPSLPERPEISYVGTSFPQIMLQSDAALARARRAGVSMFYLVTGFDPISVRAFSGGDAHARARAETAVRRCFDAGIEPYASFLVGADHDHEGTADAILEFCDRAGIRKAEFAVFTPYPGTPAWRRIEAEGRIFDRTWAHYNDTTPVFRPAKLSPDQVEAAYVGLWREFYRGRKELFASESAAARTIQF